MRLAIAKSMLANADLIVMDKPTNHVDVTGVAWFAAYIKGLEAKGVTCVSTFRKNTDDHARDVCPRL